eukprot:CAMPEP_0185591468 /NCGR_PEP_ID=MMETSP0434-20130131/64646_1 /TAXON_ID=626734 ORGANISM="Favella taraikaensis, Strain Fe Narragansett Bay" /NCGR_SAMPLE_ID=MMETSP0434 /ASSEMBLY_ACC=CAM_ASM_000379 /LENGTH=180 /DNA_ID=CAMNT_0028216499 /DNA_START=26 /DNA_END=568 /DNA_ORIENTATION=+
MYDDLVTKYPFQFFTKPYDTNFKHIIHSYNGVLDQYSDLDYDKVDFSKCQTIQVMKDLYAFHWDKMLSLSKLPSLAENPTASPVELAPGNINRRSFALASWRDEQIIFTGGWKPIAFDRGNTKKSVMVYDINSNTWKRRANMNKDRSNHSSCVLRDKAFVFGGSRGGNYYSGFIEVLDLL